MVFDRFTSYKRDGFREPSTTTKPCVECGLQEVGWSVKGEFYCAFCHATWAKGEQWDDATWREQRLKRPSLERKQPSLEPNRWSRRDRDVTDSDSTIQSTQTRETTSTTADSAAPSEEAVPLPAFGSKFGITKPVSESPPSLASAKRAESPPEWVVGPPPPRIGDRGILAGVRSAMTSFAEKTKELHTSPHVVECSKLEEWQGARTVSPEPTPLSSTGPHAGPHIVECSKLEEWQGARTHSPPPPPQPTQRPPVGDEQSRPRTKMMECSDLERNLSANYVPTAGRGVSAQAHPGTYHQLADRGVPHRPHEGQDIYNKRMQDLQDSAGAEVRAQMIERNVKALDNGKRNAPEVIGPREQRVVECRDLEEPRLLANQPKENGHGANFSGQMVMPQRNSHPSPQHARYPSPPQSGYPPESKSPHQSSDSSDGERRAFSAAVHQKAHQFTIALHQKAWEAYNACPDRPPGAFNNPNSSQGGDRVVPPRVVQKPVSTPAPPGRVVKPPEQVISPEAGTVPGATKLELVEHLNKQLAELGNMSKQLVELSNYVQTSTPNDVEQTSAPLTFEKCLIGDQVRLCSDDKQFKDAFATATTLDMEPCLVYKGQVGIISEVEECDSTVGVVFESQSERVLWFPPAALLAHKPADLQQTNNGIPQTTNQEAVTVKISEAVEAPPPRQTKNDTSILEAGLQRWIRNSWPTAEEGKSMQNCLRDLRDFMRRHFSEEGMWRVAPFGGAVNGFGTIRSDIDVVAYETSPDEKSDAKVVLRKLRKLFDRSNRFSVTTVILHARVPILKLRYADPLGYREVDISVNNTQPLPNTRLLYAYASLDKRVAQLGVAVKLWAKGFEVCGAPMGFLSSYALIMMAVYFMQVSENHLPCLQDDGNLDGCFDEDTAALTLAKRRAKSLGWRLESELATIFHQFFAFYAREFRWGTEVVSVRIGRREDAEAEVFEELRYRKDCRLHLEDPFIKSRNLRDVMSVGAEDKFRAAIAKADKDLQAGEYHKVVPGLRNMYQ